MGSTTSRLFLHVYEADFRQRLLKNKERKLASNSSFLYIDDVLLLENSQFGDYLHLIYPNEVKDTTDTEKSASYLWPSPWNRQRMTIKNKTTTHVTSSHFQKSTSIFQHHQRTEVAFHSSNFILEIVPRTVIFWAELSCSRKRCWSKDTLLLGWSHRCKNSAGVITIWLTVTTYLYFNGYFSFYVVFCLSSITDKTLIGLYYIHE